MLWERLDPRVRLISIFLLASAVAATPARYYAKFAAYTVILVALLIISRPPLKKYMLRLLMLLPLLLFLASTLLLFSPEQWDERLRILYNLSIKTLLTFLCFGILVFTMKFNLIIRALGALRCPTIITAMLSFAQRYMLLFHQEARRIIKARKSRSFGKEGWKRKYKTAAAVAPHLLFRVLGRSQRIYAAMLSRGYNDITGMPVFTTLRLSTGDYLFISLFILTLALVIGGV